MRRLQFCFAFALLQSSAVESFQPVVHRCTSASLGRTCSSPSIGTALHATSLDETELKTVLSEYLKKRDEADADDSAKA